MCVHECRLSKYDIIQPQGWQKLLALVLPARRSIRSKLLSIGSGALPHPPTHFLPFKVFWRALLAMFIWRALLVMFIWRALLVMFIWRALLVMFIWRALLAMFTSFKKNSFDSGKSMSSVSFIYKPMKL